jgi:hypothetical protein
MLIFFLFSLAILSGTRCVRFLATRLLGLLIKSIGTLIRRLRLAALPDNVPSVPETRYPADWAARRRAVIERDGFRCRWCGRDLRHEACEVHHTSRSRADGIGDHAAATLLTLCGQCHAKAPGHAWTLGKRVLRLDRTGAIHLAGCSMGTLTGWSGEAIRDTVSRACRSQGTTRLCTSCFGHRSAREVDALQAT